LPGGRALDPGPPVFSGLAEMARTDLAGKVALVTGASAGIGLAVSRRLVAAGARVALVARTRAHLEQAARALGGEERAAVFPLDVGDLGALERLPAQVAAACGRLDLVVNNAGLHHRGPVASRSAGELAAMVQVNLAAPIVLSRAALPLLPRGGAIVNVASLAGLLPVRDAATYSATKAGLRAFARALGEELRERGIAVHTVSPGPVDTDFFGEELDRVTPITFSQPMSTPDRVADAVLACLRSHRTEIALPWFSGKLATLGYLSPRFLRLLRPAMERLGARKKAAYAARRRADTA
jgi:short-subunit dehydrogenase